MDASINFAIRADKLTIRCLIILMEIRSSRSDSSGSFQQEKEYRNEYPRLSVSNRYEGLPDERGEIEEEICITESQFPVKQRSKPKGESG